MMRYLFRSAAVVFFGSLAIAGSVRAADPSVPEPFRGFDPSSTYTINYDDLNALLSATVLNVGRSTREKAAPVKAKTGTRMKARVNVSTVNEGNRFFFETFRDNPEYGTLLTNIQKSLEQVPSEVPLEFFSRDEQLAYWLNLYNTTLINELLKVYPKRSLKKLLTGKKSILAKKVLNVAGVPLSLNDIQFTILKENYDSSPLIIYGLYQGIIGGPNIRRRAYTGENVYRYLENNAREFINSNRGTHAKDENIFKASSLYDRNRAFFDDFEADLRKHLTHYLQEPELGELQAASAIRPDIDDWTVTDLYGSYKQIGGSAADNPAALMDSVRSTSITDSGGTITTTLSADSASVMAKTTAMDRFSPDLLVRLKELSLKHEAANQDAATVTVEDIDDSTEPPLKDSGGDESDD